MTSSNNIDYINSSFKFPVSTKVQGRTDYEQLKVIKDELKANASSIVPDIGEGANERLCLILTGLEYVFVSPVPYVRLVHPGTLIIPAETPNWQATVMQEDHKEAIRIFNEVTNVDKDKLKRLGKALPKLYLNRFRNTHLNTVSTDITTVLDHLFIAHGDIEPELLDEKKST